MHRFLLPPNTVLGGRYVVDVGIGAGGMGEVYQGRLKSINKPVAIKVLLAQHSRTDDDVSRFYREAKTLARLDHPAFVDVMDVGSTDHGFPFIVMELLQGRPLSALVDEAPVSVPLAMRIWLDVISALDVAHRTGVIHRDLKPENLFLVQDGRHTRLKVLDFGIAKVSGDGSTANLTHSSTVMGSALYMAPEQAQSARDVDTRADLYSAGAIAYRLLTGRPHVEGDSFMRVLGMLLRGHVHVHPRELRPDIPPWMDQLIAASLALEPNDRPATARDLKRDLAERCKRLPPLGVLLAAWDQGPRHAAPRSASGDDLPPDTTLRPRSAPPRETLSQTHPPTIPLRSPSAGHQPFQQLTDDPTELALPRTSVPPRVRPPSSATGADTQPLEIDALEVTELGQPLDLTEPDAPPPEGSPLDRWPTRLGLAAVFLLALILGVWWGLPSASPPPSPLPEQAAMQPPAPAPAEAAPAQPAPAPADPQASAPRPPILSSSLIVPVISDPPGARILIGDELWGLTPKELDDLPAGQPVKITLTKDGYKPWVETLVPGAEGARINATLSLASVSLAVRSKPAGGSVSLDGVPVGTTPLSDIPLEPGGRHRLQITAAGYSDWEETLRPEAGEDLSITATLIPAAARSREPSDEAAAPAETAPIAPAQPAAAPAPIPLSPDAQRLVDQAKRLEREGDLDGAMSLYGQLLTVEGATALARRELARLKERTIAGHIEDAQRAEARGDTKQALLLYAEAAKLDRNNKEAREGISRLRAQQGSAEQRGELFINSLPYGLVYIDGVKMGYTPVHQLDLAPRDYVIRVTNPDNAPCSTVRAVRPGERTFVYLKLDDDELCGRAPASP